MAKLNRVPKHGSCLMGIDEKAWDAIRKQMPNDADFVLKARGIVTLYEAAKVPVSVEVCAKALSAATLARFPQRGYNHEQDYNRWKDEYISSAKAVLDAAGVKYGN